MARKAGRPFLKGGRVKFTTTLPERVVTHLRALGNGNASQAIIALAEADFTAKKNKQ